MSIADKPLIILIGGAAGTGKTSLAKQLSDELNITHRLGSGFVREIAQSFVSQEENAYLYNYSFRPHTNISPFDNLYKQSEVIKPPIEACIKRAHDEGTSIVIEGVNIIPGLINDQLATLFVVLTVEDYDRHFEMIHGNTHFQRKISKEDFDRVRAIQEDFKRVAMQNQLEIIDVGSSDDTVVSIKELIKKGENS